MKMLPVYQVNYNLNVDPHPATAEYKNDFIKDLFIQVLQEFKPSLVHFTHAMKIFRKHHGSLQITPHPLYSDPDRFLVYLPQAYLAEMG